MGYWLPNKNILPKTATPTPKVLKMFTTPVLKFFNNQPIFSIASKIKEKTKNLTWLLS